VTGAGVTSVAAGGASGAGAGAGGAASAAGGPRQVLELADQVAAAVLECPDVAALTQIPGIPVATYLPGRTVSGVAVRAGQVEVCVIARYGLPLPQIAEQVRQAVTPLVTDRVVDVVIADITSPPQHNERNKNQ
jgi:uncharacterized alkaline shock family protein YloU